MKLWDTDFAHCIVQVKYLSISKTVLSLNLDLRTKSTQFLIKKAPSVYFLWRFDSLEFRFL